MSLATNKTSTGLIQAPAIRPSAIACLAPITLWSQELHRRPVGDMGKALLAMEVIHPRWTDNHGTRVRWADGGGSYPSLAIGSIQYGRLDVYYCCLSFALGEGSMFRDAKHHQPLRAVAPSHQIGVMRNEA